MIPTMIRLPLEVMKELADQEAREGLAALDAPAWIDHSDDWSEEHVN